MLQNFATQLLDSNSLVLHKSLFTNYSGKKRHADKSGSTQLITVWESLSSCTLKCGIGYIIPIPSGGNQTLLRTGLCRIQVLFLQWGVNFGKPFSHLSHFITLKTTKYCCVLCSALIGLLPLLLSHQNQPKIHQQGVFLPELKQNPQRSQSPRFAQGNFWEQFLLEAELLG